MASIADAARLRGVSIPPNHLLLWLCLLAFALPTMIDVARNSWATEQGGHGPIVLAVGIWLVSREWASIRAVARPGSLGLTLAILIPLLLLQTLARITSTIEVEAFAMYMAVITVLYRLWGSAALRRVWFPLFLLLFTFPPPDTLFAMITQPLKIAISHWAVSILDMLDYPVANSGVMIQIGQYQALIAAACAGVNSLLSLTALGLFYSYIRYKSDLPYMVVLIALIVPIAVVVNLIRVLLLLLVTYHFGEAAGQGIFHDVAGISMFVLALGLIFLADWVGSTIRHGLLRRKAA